MSNVFAVCPGQAVEIFDKDVDTDRRDEAIALSTRGFSFFSDGTALYACYHGAIIAQIGQIVNPFDQDLNTTDNAVFASVDTGQGANELYAMNQNVRTGDAVTFLTVNTGQGDNELYAMNQNVRTIDDVTFGKVTATSLVAPTLANNVATSAITVPATLTAAQSFVLTDESQTLKNKTIDYNLNTITNLPTYTPTYATDQNTRTTDNVTFATVNTGQGANELYPMDQNVTTTSSPTFVDVTSKIKGLTVTASTGTLTVPNAKIVSFADSFSTAGAFSTSGAFSIALNATNTTSATLPAGTVTLVDLASSQALTTKTYNGLAVTTTTGTLTVPNLKTVQFSDAFTTTGAYPLTLTATATTVATLPSGTVTLVDTSSSQALTTKTYNGLNVTSTSGTLTVTGSATLTVGASASINQNCSTTGTPSFSAVTATNVYTASISADSGASFVTVPGSLVGSQSFVVTAATQVLTNKRVTFSAGTASVGTAPLYLTGGTNLTNAEAGAVEWDNSVLYFTHSAGQRSSIPTQFYQVSTGLTLTNSNSSQPIFVNPSNDSLTLIPGKYHLHALYYITRNAGTTSRTLNLSYGGTATFTIMYIARTTSATSMTLAAENRVIVTVSTSTPVTAASSSSSEQNTIELDGIIDVSVAGTLTPNLTFSALSAPGGTATLVSGSYFLLTKIGPSATAYVGNWA